MSPCCAPLPALPRQVALPEDAEARMGRPLSILEDVPLDGRHMTWHLKDSGGWEGARRWLAVGGLLPVLRVTGS